MLYLQWLITASLVLFPVVALPVKGGANKCIYLLLLISLICIVLRCKPMGQTFSQVLKKYWPIHLSMAGTVVAILITQILSGRFNGNVYDIPSRLAFFAPIMWLLLLLPLEHLKKIQWGMVAGALVAAIKIHFAAEGLPAPPMNIDFINRIPYGDITLLLGVFSLLSIGWSERTEKWAIALKAAGGCAGLYTVYFSQARGGWIAIPVFAVVGLAIYGDVFSRRRLAVFALAVALLGAAFSFSDIVRFRIEEADSDIGQYLDGANADTSIGLRFQLWRGSWVLFKEHPLTGVGRDRFAPEALNELHERGIISAAATGFGHSHSEFFYNIAVLGIFGLISFFAIYIVPGYYFYRAACEPDKELKAAGGMGLALCLGYFIFGLTEAIFHTPIACAFYSICAAAFMAYIVKRRHILAKQWK